MEEFYFLDRGLLAIGLGFHRPRSTLRQGARAAFRFRHVELPCTRDAGSTLLRNEQTSETVVRSAVVALLSIGSFIIRFSWTGLRS